MSSRDVCKYHTIKVALQSVSWFICLLMFSGFSFTLVLHVSTLAGGTSAPTDVLADGWLTFPILPLFKSPFMDSVNIDFTTQIFISPVTRQHSIQKDWFKRL